MLWPKKNSYKERVNGKRFLRLENSHPDNFSHGPSLNNTAPEYLTAWRFGRPQPRTELF